MKKISLITILLVFSACSAQYTPNFILKHTNKDAYTQKIINQNCQDVTNNRVVQVDGVAGAYDYTSNYDSSLNANCDKATIDFLDTYQYPSQYAQDREDVKPLTY